jgi:hypothetical protein
VFEHLAWPGISALTGVASSGYEAVIFGVTIDPTGCNIESRAASSPNPVPGADHIRGVKVGPVRRPRPYRASLGQIRIGRSGDQR